MKVSYFTPVLLYRKLLIVISIVVVFVASFLVYKTFQQELGIKPEGLRIVLWAWERPEDLRFLEKYDASVAYLAGSVTIQDSKVKTRQRMQPLVIAEKTPLISVIRIDNFSADLSLDQKEYDTLTDFIVQMCGIKEKIRQCQLDFDATQSELDFYSRLIMSVKEKLPKETDLSITSLVSWCHQGSWFDDLPIREAIPMFFDLGVDEHAIRSGQVGNTFMKSSKCQHAVGVSTDDQMPDSAYIHDRTVYIFNPRSWTTQDYRDILNAITNNLNQ